MKKNLTKALLLTSLISMPTFAEVDDYQKRSSQQYGDGTLKAIPELIMDIIIVRDNFKIRNNFENCNSVTIVRKSVCLLKHDVAYTI